MGYIHVQAVNAPLIKAKKPNYRQHRYLLNRFQNNNRSFETLEHIRIV